MRYPFGLLLAGMFAAVGCQSGPEPEPVSPLLDARTRDLLIQSEEALRQHAFDAALAYADSAEARIPDGADVPFLRGRVYSEMARLPEADSAYRRALALRPDYAGAWNNLGNNAARQQRYREAIALYHKELEREPAPVPWRGIGMAYVELGVADSAQYAFNQALATDTSYALAHQDLAQLYDDDGQFEQALHHAQRALALDPENNTARYLTGALLAKMGRNEEALPYLEAVTEGWPWHSASHYNLGQALARLGRPEEAQEHLDRAEALRALQAKITLRERAVRSLPEDPYTHAALASLLRQAGRYNDAMHAYQVALSLQPGDTDFMNNIAVLHLLRGENAEAIQWFERIVQQDATLVDAWLNLGIVYAKSGQEADARRAWETVLRQQPGHPAAEAYLARLDSSATPG